MTPYAVARARARLDTVRKAIAANAVVDKALREELSELEDVDAFWLWKEGKADRPSFIVDGTPTDAELRANLGRNSKDRAARRIARLEAKIKKITDAGGTSAFLSL